MAKNKNISLIYSTKDNEPRNGAVKGWVTDFHRFLSTFLYQITRKKPEIRLIDESNFSPSLFDDSDVIVILVTVNLQTNTEIVTALDNHGTRLINKNQLIIDGVSRLFKVLMRPYDADSLLPALADLLTYDFYSIDPLTGESQEFTRFLGNDAERGFWMKMVDVAYDINHILKAPDTIETKGKYEKPAREKTIYLSNTGIDMVIQRDIIKRELIRHGYKVLPDHSLPKEVKSLDQMIRDDLDRCCLSIHMVGEDYGDKPKGSKLSVVEIQNQVASDHASQIALSNKDLQDDERKTFSRLIWVSPDLKNVTERQKIFIEHLKSDAASFEESEVLQIPLQELRSIIREELVTGGRFNEQKDLKKLQEHEEEDEQVKLIYLIADKRDIYDTNEMQGYLKKQGYNVVAPSYEGDLVDLRYIHQENLRRCDASIIYFGQSTEDWINTKLQDLKKAPGFGREKPMLAKAVYFKGEKNVDINQFKKHDAMVIGQNGSFNPENLKPFLNQIAVS